MSAEEFNDGYPQVDSLRSGESVTVRVLRREEDKIWVTRRSGDLARPSSRQYKDVGDAKDFQGLGKAEWLEGKVIRMIPPGQIFVSVTPPRSDADAVGLLNLKDTPHGFAEEAYPGMPVKVRVKKINVERNRMVLSMRMPAVGAPAAREEAAEAAMEELGKEDGGEAADEEQEASPAPSPEAASATPGSPAPAPAPRPPESDLFAFLKR
mmetsp:Transcript_65632/g.195347  ORF Transcript_65632/g.195347 Transcript_65632/m.195347 type:complete len:209 (+) Transcript_65632:1-627(+)